MSEDEFLKSTPRMLGALWDIHTKFNGWEIKDDKENNHVGKRMYIDEVPFL